MALPTGKMADEVARKMAEDLLKPGKIVRIDNVLDGTGVRREPAGGFASGGLVDFLNRRPDIAAAFALPCLAPNLTRMAVAKGRVEAGALVKIEVDDDGKECATEIRIERNGQDR